jgi:hypothetical protein
MLRPDEPEPDGDPPEPEGGEPNGEFGTNGDPPEPAEGALPVGCRAVADRGCQATRPTPNPAAIATTTSKAAAVIVRIRRVSGGGAEVAQ